jgi:hypothetical protein
MLPRADREGAARFAAARAAAGTTGASELVSRVYMATIATIVCAPLSLLLVFGALPAQIARLSASPSPQAFADALGGLVLLAALACLWRLIAAFVGSGQRALRDLDLHWWALPLATAAVAVALTFRALTVADDARSWLDAFVWGAPLLIPLAHLAAERWLRSAARPEGDRAFGVHGLHPRGDPPTG